MLRPLRYDQAAGVMSQRLAQPIVRVVTPGERHWSILCDLPAPLGTAANLTTDAHLRPFVAPDFDWSLITPQSLARQMA